MTALHCDKLVRRRGNRLLLLLLLLLGGCRGNRLLLSGNLARLLLDYYLQKREK